jgi:VanZ family protein
MRNWIVALLWLSLIALESTNTMSAENTTRWLYPLFHRLTGVDFLHFQIWDHYLRKTGHFVGYFMLSLFMFGAWRSTLRVSWAAAWTVRWASAAFLSAAVVASLDEWHQTFLPERTGTIRDVFLDSAAALTAQLLIAFLLRWRTARRGPERETQPSEVGTA